MRTISEFKEEAEHQKFCKEVVQTTMEVMQMNIDLMENMLRDKEEENKILRSLLFWRGRN